MERGESESDSRRRATTSEERRETLDQELDESLSEFDRKMLEEQEVLARQRTSASAIAGGGGSADGGGGASGRGMSGGAETRTEGGGAGTREAGEAVADESKGAGTGARTPPDIPDGRDDDIVARQLREAAVKEDDPRLRDRLWDEYRRYKGLPVQGDRGEAETDSGEETPAKEGGDAG